MRKYIPTFTALLLATVTGFAADTVVFRNGDVLTGEILKQTDDHVYFRSPSVGAVSLSKLDIVEIRAHVEAVADAPAEKALPEAAEPAPVAPPQLAQQETTPLVEKKEEPAKPKQWSGQAGLSIAMRESNTLRRSGNGVTEKQESFESYRLYGNVKWKSETARDNLRWDWTYRYSRSDLRLNDDFFNVSQNYKHTFSDDNFFTSAKTIYQKDYRRRIENEFLQTAELGVKWFNQPTFQLSTSAGGGYHMYDRLVYDSATQETDNLYVSQPTFIFDQSLRWQVVNSLTLIQKYAHLGDLTNYHFLFSAGLENKLVRDLFLRVEYRLDRDTEVTYDDRGYYDKALLTSVLYKF